MDLHSCVVVNSVFADRELRPLIVDVLLCNCERVDLKHKEQKMTGALIPLWIIGGPFLALLILSFSFGKSSAMPGGRGLRSDDPDTSLSSTTGLRH